ncbi:DUF305 domain-containing protein [Actinoplanes sp. CA-030573]|uniref:DUF305 domain-containing protein n=1 Tax=Actinoplanes sp. CA-030573 TaxID=3239898 RepID=UPI003D8B8ED4
MRRVSIVLVVALALGGCGTAPQREPTAAPGAPGPSGAPAPGGAPAVPGEPGAAGMPGAAGTPAVPGEPGAAAATGAGRAGAGNSGGPAKAGARHAPADVAFVTALLPHHQQGIGLAREAAGRPEARTLAEAIIVTQQDEMVRMTGWLREWGGTPPPTAGTATTTARRGGDAIRALIAHQEEAIKLAQQEQANGINPTALDFAKQVIESRAGEVDQLHGYVE